MIFLKIRILGIALIIVGLSIIGSALYMRHNAEKEQKNMIAEYEKILKEMGEENNEAGSNGQSTEETAAGGNTAGDTPSRPSTINSNAIAILEIPKLDLTVAVVEGTEVNDLKYAVGHFKDTALPGEKGNFCVAGHRSYTYNEYFNRLDELKVGDIIRVRTEKGTFEYEMYEQKIVEPKEVSVLNPTKDATITLVTCTPIRVASHRLIIKGRLK